MTASLILIFALAASPEPTRSFQMGFTLWPYAATNEAVQDVYQRVQDHGDIVAHHLQGGIPWSEALTNGPYPPAVVNEIQGRRSAMRADQAIYLALNSLNMARDGLPPYWAEQDNLPLPQNWAEKTFDDPDVIQAFIHFSTYLIDQFQPSYFNYGTEISELMLNDPDGYADYLVFAEQVYAALKARYPNLPLMVSIALKHPQSSEAQTIQSLSQDLLPFVDIIGISSYPYAFYGLDQAGNPNSLPTGWLSQIKSISAQHPIAITETGWIAENLQIDTFGLNVASNPSFQNDYLEALFTESNRLNAEFLIWFCSVDFDTLWLNEMNSDPVGAIWRDTGLWDENRSARPGLILWDSWLGYSRRDYTIWIPHIATSWDTYLISNGIAGTTCFANIDLFGDQGQPLGTRSVELGFFSKTALNDLHPEAHSGKIKPAQDSTATRLVYVHPVEGGLAEFVLDGRSSKVIRFLYHDFSPEQVSLTWQGLALVNQGPETAEVQFSAFNTDGALLDVTSQAVASHQRVRFLLNDLFPNQTNIVLVVAESEHPLSGVAISGNGGSQLLFSQAE